MDAVDDSHEVVVSQQPFADTRHRVVTYRVRAASRFASFYRDPVESIESDRVEVSIPSSKRPSSPVLDYIVQVFRWEQHVTERERTSARWGGGLRVYFQRGRFSSGDGELLGVVLWPSSADNVSFLETVKGRFRPQERTDICDILSPYVSQWGADPVYQSGAIRGFPAITDFRNVYAYREGLTLGELEGKTRSDFGCKDADDFLFSVAAFEAELDEARNLWRCDIEMKVENINAYFPFVRLALVHFQPDSIQNAHVSGVTLADFAQLTPNRFASVQYDRHDSKRLTLLISGTSYVTTNGGGSADLIYGPSEMVVTLEQQCRHYYTDMTWTKVPFKNGELEMVAHPQTSGTEVTTWKLDVPLPESRHSRHFRVAIVENEILPTEVRWDRDTLVRSRRTVYADILQI